MSQLSPAPKFAVTYVNASGYTVPAVGYKLYTYTAGTSTPKATYTDYTLGSSNTNPVVMDARGECNLWLSGNYKLVLKTDADVTVWTVDEVRDLTSSQTLTNMTLAGTLTVTSTAVTWSGNPTHSGNHTWTGNQVFNGNVTIGDSAADTLTITPNAVTWSNNPTHSGAHTWSGVQTYSSNPAGKIVAGTYTPTLANQANATAGSTAHLSTYNRIGDVVTVYGYLDSGVLDAAAGASTQIRVSLPIASNFASGTDCTGVCSTYDNNQTEAYVFSDAATNTAIVFWFAFSTGTRKVYYTFQYQVL
jgi:hypothetical protein